ncbi:hypothetical protein ColKHC_03568 [Colletotrichum higginsianum]|nr:hypothetical protein ColKHC_03568 [Colletotrichum higginsianum]
MHLSDYSMERARLDEDEVHAHSRWSRSSEVVDKDTDLQIGSVLNATSIVKHARFAVSVPLNSSSPVQSALARSLTHSPIGPIHTPGQILVLVVLGCRGGGGGGAGTRTERPW